MENNISFNELNLSKTSLDAITKKGFKVASEVQAKVIPIIFEQKSDVIGIAQTGTGKTGAFGLPLIDLIETGNKFPQAIILAPTRELALQVTTEIEMLSGDKRLNMLTVYGGAPMSTQIRTLKRGVDIVVGTPGRVLDLLKRGDLVLKEVSHFVLDEADEMLKMGFIEDIEYILASAAKKKRVYLFSATMPDRIKQLSKKYMENQVIIEVKTKQEINKLIEQSFCKARQSEKFDALTKIIDMEDFFYGIIFCRTKADVDKVTSALKKSGHEVDCIHGDIIQSKRERILNKFKNLKLSILVATDVAARGIDVENLSHVINYSLPEDVETYTHRIGRTGRAGNKGKAISLVTPSEMRRISQIERTLKTTLSPLKLPSQQEISQRAHKKFLIEIDGIVESIDTSEHLSIADQLLAKHDSAKVVSALLHKINAKKVSSSDSSFDSGFDRPERGDRFGSRDRGDRGDRSNRGDRFGSRDRGDRDNAGDGSRRERSRNRNSSGSNERIFIAKGKMDKMDKRSLINFIEKETRVKLGDVRDVKVCDKFSFLTLDSDQAHQVVDAFEERARGRRPIAEIAQK